MANNREYSYIIPEIKDWPIFTLSRDRQEFIEEVTEFTVNRFTQTQKDKLSEELAKVLYQERIRVKEEPWKVDPPHEIEFWNRLRRQLIKKSFDQAGSQVAANNEEILTAVVNRYSNEIAGHFKISTYKFARRFLTAAFNRLLNTASNRNLRRFYSARYKLRERLKIHGEIGLLRSLGTKGTIVLVPTHFSNLDSIMLGWGVDSIGLPAMSYGAGLNLFNNAIMSYFFNRLGAYKLDRRKKNPVYLETLKAFSNLSIQRGTHTLFFPGGTRERSGALEKKLKMGLLGTVTEAQRSLYESGKDNKIFIVPVVTGYNFVLEAESLINDYLRRTGKEMYVGAKSSFSVWKTTHFLWKFFSASSEIQISFGKPMDVLGNFVDEEGISYDDRNKEVELRDYFVSDGKITVNLQRDMEYTRILSEKIIDRFHKENIVLCSHLVAFTAFNILKAKNQNLDLYGLMRLAAEERVIKKESFNQAIAASMKILKILEEEGKLKLDAEMKDSNIKKIIEVGIKNIGIYHADAPVLVDVNGDFTSGDMKLLFYYHNRLLGYHLEKNVKWTDFFNPAPVLSS